MRIIKSIKSYVVLLCLLIGWSAMAQSASTSAEFEALQGRRSAILKEIRHCQDKIANADKKLIGAEATGDEQYITKWVAEKTAWEGRLKFAKEEIALLETELSGYAEQVKATAVGAPAAPAVDDGLVRIGDTLEIVITEDESFNGLYQVRQGGYIILPQVGRVAVAGKDQAAAEAGIREALGKSLIRDATVLVELPFREAAAPRVQGEEPARHVYLVGEWKQYGGTVNPKLNFDIGTAPMQSPGLQILPRENPTVVKVVLRWGTLPYADLEHVKVLRLLDGKPLVEEVNVKAVLAGNDLASDMALQHEDIIIIPTLGGTNRVYISGSVGKPEQILALPDDEELTCLTAIIRSGGQDRYANLRKVFVLRDLGSGQKTRIDVDIKAVKRGEIPDLVLQANDVIVVPEKFFSF